MTRLQVTRESMYSLVNSYNPLPRGGRIRFERYANGIACKLSWEERESGKELICEAFLSMCVGNPVLAITRKDRNGKEISREEFEDIGEELRGRHMLQAL